MNNTDFVRTITDSSKELTPVERLRVKMGTDAVSLDRMLDSVDEVIIDIDYYAVVSIHNERAQNKDYMRVMLVEKNGNMYYTGSNTFYVALMEILNEIAGEGADNYVIKAFRKPSKNYSGKFFITASIDYKR